MSRSLHPNRSDSREVVVPIRAGLSNLRPLFPTPAGVTPYDRTRERTGPAVAVDTVVVRYVLAAMELVADPPFPEAHAEAIHHLRQILAPPGA